MDKLQSISSQPRGSGSVAAQSMPDVQSMLAEDPITDDDLQTALGSTKPSSDGNMDKYIAWQAEFGSV